MNQPSADGVFREAFSVFYRDLFQSSGIDAYVPMSLSASQAKCLGRILTRAFVQSNFFPVNISKAYFEYAIFGKVREQTLLTSFLQFVLKNERRLLEKYLYEGKASFNGDKKEIIWELFMDAGITTLRTPQSIKQLVINVLLRELAL